MPILKQNHCCWHQLVIHINPAIEEILGLMYLGYQTIVDKSIPQMEIIKNPFYLEKNSNCIVSKKLIHQQRQFAKSIAAIPPRTGIQNVY